MPTNVHYQFTPIPFTAVQLDDLFWSPRIETNRTVTVPYDFQKCEETDRISNFEKAAGQLAGDHVGIFFNDSDVFKVIEGAAYALHPAFAGDAPYAPVIVEMDEGVRMLGRVLDCPPEALAIGMPVAVEFVAAGGGAVHLPYFRRSAA